MPNLVIEALVVMSEPVEAMGKLLRIKAAGTDLGIPNA